MQMILEQWLSNSILVHTNQLQNLFYKFSFTLFITAQRTKYVYKVRNPDSKPVYNFHLERLLCFECNSFLSGEQNI